MQKYLPVDEFCLIVIPEEKIFYGVMDEELHSKFMDILSGETLECLEYMDEKDLKNLDYSKSDIIGNEDLLKKIS